MAWRSLRRWLPGTAFACCAAIFSALAVPHGARAQTAQQPQYMRRIWHIQDGLPEETIQAIQQTRDGYLWVGTTGGLVRFDGFHFVHFMQPQQHGALTDDSTFCILAAHDGSLWLGTEGEGLLHYRNGVFRAYTASDGLTDSFVRSLIEDSMGRIWIGTDNGLFRVSHGKVEVVDTAPYGPLPVHGIFEDRQHRIWVGGSKLLVFRSTKTGAELIRRYQLPGAFSQNRVKSIYQTRDGTIWVGTVGGLDRFVDGRFRAIPDIAGTVRTLLQTTDGTLWIGTIGHGLFTYKNGVFDRMGGNGLLPSKTVLSIYEDNAQQVWVGTQDGLVCLSKTPVSVTPLPGGSDPDYETISHDPDGTIWAIASSVYAIRGGVAHAYKFDRMPNVPVRNVFRDRTGVLWVGTDGSGAYRLTPGGTIHYSAPHRLVNNFIRAFLQARDGTIWIATDEGVSRIDGERVQNFHVRDGLAYFSTRALMEDNSGDIWIGTDHGLSHWHAGAFLSDAVTEALDKEKVWSILQDHGGDIWFGTRDHGLFRYHAGQLMQYTTAQGLISNNIYQVLEDRQGNLWLSGPNTISSFRLSRIDAASFHRTPYLGVTVYQMPYSADGAQMYGGRQPSGCLGTDGGVWFPSNKGAIHIVPAQQPVYPAPRLLITSIVSDGRTLPLGRALTLQADASRLAIVFAPLMLRPQEGLRFRYRLENFDPGWTYVRGNREAMYTNLPPGRYVFRAVAFEVNHPELTSEISFSILKRPYFYRTWWFLSLCLLALCLLAAGIYRSRMRMVRVRFHAVLEERSRLAREMHDTVIQGCTSVSALLEAISSLQQENHGPQNGLLNYARTQVRTTIDEARQAVWNLRHDDEPMEDFPHALTGIGELIGKEFGLRVECATIGRPLPIQGSTARELLMVVREALYNAALHGHPSSILVTLNYRHDEMLLGITDDGSGFNPMAVNQDGKQHYGLAGMRERVERVHGGMELTSIPGKGTTVQVRLRRSHLLNASAKVAMKKKYEKT